ncbi:MAG: hypothetical protein ABI779_11775 [Acidobacteriota bacterium]
MVRAIHPRGADVILDPVGSEAFDRALRDDLSGRKLMGGLLETRAGADRDVQAELERLAPRPLIGKVFPFRELPDALDAVLDRANYGKHVIVME